MVSRTSDNRVSAEPERVTGPVLTPTTEQPESRPAADDLVYVHYGNGWALLRPRPVKGGAA